MKINPVVFKRNFGASVTEEQPKLYNDLRVFRHHIYEYKKGLRNLVLTTEKAEYRDCIVKKLESQGIPYLISKAGENTINVFFGNEECVKTISTLNPRLNKHTPEEDFMLGILLGYDKIQQCTRYLNKISHKQYSN